MKHLERRLAMRSWIMCFLVLAFCLATSEGRSQHQEPIGRQTDSAEGHTPQKTVFEESRRLSEEGKFDEAIQKLEALHESNPEVGGISRELGSTYYKKGDFVKAIASLKQALDEEPDDREATQLLGLSYYLSGRPAEAIPFLEKVQSWFPRANVDAAYILGIAYIQTKDYPHARTAFARMFDVPPDSAAAYLFTARMLLRQEFDPVAEEYAQKAVALDPKLPLAHYLLGELHLYKSRVPEAIAEFEKEIALNPANAATYYKLADAYSRVQKYDDAERLLQRSIWLDATSTGPYILMGKVLQKKGELELAVRALQRAISMDPNNPISHHLLGQTYRDMGKKEEADAELKLGEQLRTRQDARP
jgi:tetratricopeptide (TPR) repeat protein